jgi:phosphomevalonate kinase
VKILNNILTVTAPGKLMLSGEWSVLERNVPCIVMAVNSRVYASIKTSNEIKVFLRDFNIESDGKIVNDKIIFTDDQKELNFTKYAINMAIKVIKDRNMPLLNFYLETYTDTTILKDEETGEDLKVGFGSSAAAVVAIITAILAYHNIVDINKQNDKELIFKLAILAHYFGQGKIGSGFDVAASTFGGVIKYKRFDPDWLQNNLKNAQGQITKVLSKNWPILEHNKISIPKDFVLFVAFTGTSASTRKLIAEIKDFKKNNPLDYQKIVNDIKTVTEGLITSLRNDNKLETLKLLDKNRELLHKLSDACSCSLEIDAHRLMSEIAGKYDAVSKFSGAGGGDCSIGVTFNPQTAELILNEWQKYNFTPIDVKISEEGVKIEKNAIL